MCRIWLYCEKGAMKFTSFFLLAISVLIGFSFLMPSNSEMPQNPLSEKPHFDSLQFYCWCVAGPMFDGWIEGPMMGCLTAVNVAPKDLVGADTYKFSVKDKNAMLAVDSAMYNLYRQRPQLETPATGDVRMSWLLFRGGKADTVSYLYPNSLLINNTFATFKTDIQPTMMRLLCGRKVKCPSR